MTSTSTTSNGRSFTLFGKPVDIKTTGCNHTDVPGGPIPPSVNLFVKVTDGCNARCPFCSNAGAAPTTSFDADKLITVIDEILSQGLLINRINITGGEPSAVPQRVEHLLSRLDCPVYRTIHLHLNTNGLLPQAQALMRHPRWDSISVSLHHYDRRKLSEIYRTPITPDALQFDGIDRMKLNASCNLIRGYIDTTAEAHRMMDHCLDLSLLRLGFVGLMPVNPYSQSHLVPLDVLQLHTIPHCYHTESKDRGPHCRCSNYIYNRHLRVLDIYMRHYADPSYCASSLLFDGSHLRQGFYSHNIIL